MINSTITLLPVGDIHVLRDHRQRSELTPDSVLDLAASIAANGWISPLIVSADDMHIVAGERRYTAVCLLQRALQNDFSSFTKPDDARTRLLLSPPCPNPDLENWTKVPAQLGTNLDVLSKQLIELIENLHRVDLEWKDQAKACYTLHEMLLRQALPTGKKWTISDTAQMIGLGETMVGTYIRTWRDMSSPNEHLSKIIAAAPSVQAAARAAERIKSRHEPITLTYPKPDIVSISPHEPDPDPVLVNDFNEWAPVYDGAPFNFIHADFPYGIQFNKGGGMHTAVDTLSMGTYDDRPEVYWELLSTLCACRDNLLSTSAHIMLWFSQNLRRETEDFFRSAWPDVVIQPFLMIWHRNNVGIVPDPQRYGRRTYETAMLLTLGDRKIVVPKALSFTCQREETTVHRSQKASEMLSHFFGMFVDNSTCMLDPTCGSGTSIIAAKSLSAKHALGLELDPDMVIAANKLIKGAGLT